MKVILFTIFFAAHIGHAKIRLDNSWQVKSADLQYTVNFPLKTIKGHNKNVKGKAVCQKELCEFLVGAEVGLFDSGDSNRDLHMREVTKQSLFPVVAVRGHLPQELNSDVETLDLEIEFAGQKVVVPKVPVQIVQTSDGLSAEGQFNISLKNFKIKAPSLLGVKVDDEVLIHFKTIWNSI